MDIGGSDVTYKLPEKGSDVTYMGGSDVTGITSRFPYLFPLAHFFAKPKKAFW